MKRNVTLEEISDGRLYKENDMVKADCHGCQGCSHCCRGMGDSIILDPYDIYRLTTGLDTDMEALLNKELVLNVVDGVILPNLKMAGQEEKCSFLNRENRCSIHPYRPGICRLFPLGRYYEKDDFFYFLQKGECVGTKLSKVKVSKWIDTPDSMQNKAFILKWHALLKEMEELLLENTEESFGRNLNLFFLRTFYMAPYEKERDFYEQFAERYQRFREIVS